MEGKGLELRVSALEARVQLLDSLIDKIIKGAETSPKRKTTREQKEAAKQRLLDAGPYDKKSLEEMGGKDLRILASALNINSFGMARDKIVAAILTSQKPKNEKTKKEKSKK